MVIPQKSSTERILVVGGAGYIGSHMLKLLNQNGANPLIIDNLSTGHQSAIVTGDFFKKDIGEKNDLKDIFENHNISAVIHFAARSIVSESTTNPSLYYHNNVSKTQTLLDAMVEFGIRDLVFSSSAAVYGDPLEIPLTEDHPQNPINPYGTSKWIVERMLSDYRHAYGIRFAALRYFNAAGADPDTEIGERHEPETHLIPNLLQVASGRQTAFTLNGRDYPTKDGTCIRDYIHVMDLCDAHLKALTYLQKGGTTQAFNLGTGMGYSINEVIKAAEKATHKRIAIQEGERRKGDPARLVADPTRAREILGWSPRFGLDDIVEHAWRWERHLSAP